MAIRNDAGFRNSLATAIRGRVLFLAMALAGAGFQGCSTEDKEAGPVGTGGGEDTVEDAGFDVTVSAGKERLDAFRLDSVQQAADEDIVDNQSGSPHDTIVTPLGKIERRCVYQLRPDEVLVDENTVSSKTGLRKIANEQGCEFLDRKSDTLGSPLVKSAASNKDGWVMAGWWALPFVGHELWSDITVPRHPVRKSDQIIFLFSSFQNAKSTWIVQPVLQWGTNGNIGGKYWTMANWIVGPNNRSYISTPVKVYPGDALWGYIHATNCNSSGQCTWTLDFVNSVRHTSTKLKSTIRLPAMKSAQGGVMETYGLERCDEYPDQAYVTFTHISVFDDKPTWRKSAWTKALYPTSPSCRFNVTMTQSTSSSVGLWWNTGT